MQKIMDKIKHHIDDRDWDQFHTPRNLAISISLEASEVLEKFHWKLDETLSEKDLEDLQEELADVLIYTFLLCYKLKMDPEEIIENKLIINNSRYPVEKAKGKSTKYNKL